jgi:hypothetical protein
MEVAIDFGNNFSSGAKSVQITECDLRVTPGVPSGINYAPPVPNFRPIYEELVFCQRYYFNSLNNNGSGVGTSIKLSVTPMTTGVVPIGMIFLPVPMRIAPVWAFNNPGFSNANSIGQDTLYTNQATSVQVNSTTSASLVSVAFDYVASAEL